MGSGIQSYCTVTMLMTSIPALHLSVIRKRMWAAIPFIIFFGAIEAMFFFSSLTSSSGGYFTVLMATAIALSCL